MTEAIITAAVALIVCLINNHYQHQSTEQKHEETVRLIEYKLDQLTKKVDLHNNAVERLYIVEKRLGIDEKEIEVANHRIKDLEQGRE